MPNAILSETSCKARNLPQPPETQSRRARLLRSARALARKAASQLKRGSRPRSARRAWPWYGRADVAWNRSVIREHRPKLPAEAGKRRTRIARQLPSDTNGRRWYSRPSSPQHFLQGRTRWRCPSFSFSLTGLRFLWRWICPKSVSIVARQ